MFRKLALASAMLVAFATSAFGACPAPATVSGSNAVALQAVAEANCAYLDNQHPGRATYMAVGTGYAAYATPTDLLCLTGSASKTVRVTQLSIKIQSTAAAIQTIYVVKRSTANTGGTATNPTGVLFDSTNAAQSAVVTLYTAAPTLGAATAPSGGNIAIMLATSATLTTAPGIITMTNFATIGTIAAYGQPVVLRGTSQMLCLNYAGAALTSGFTSDWAVEWTEE